MRALAAVLLIACGGADAVAGCPTSPASTEYCCPSELGQERHVDGHVYRCDPIVTGETDDGGFALFFDLWNYVGEAPASDRGAR